MSGRPSLSSTQSIKNSSTILIQHSLLTLGKYVTHSNNSYRYSPSHWAWFSHNGHHVWEHETTNNIVERFNRELKADGINNTILQVKIQDSITYFQGLFCNEKTA